MAKPLPTDELFMQGCYAPLHITAGFHGGWRGA